MSHRSGNAEILESVFSATNVLFAFMDPDFNLIRVNRAYAEAGNRRPEFYVGKNHFDLFPREDDEETFRRVVDTGEAHTAKARTFECFDRPGRGASYWDWTLQPVHDESGKVKSLVLCLMDATERVETERRLRETESRLSTAVECLPYDFFVLDTDSRCTFQNAASRKTWGHVVGKRPRDVAVDPDTLRLWESNNRRALAGELVEEDVEFQVGCGTRHCRNIIAPIRDGGEIIGIQGINIDITEIKQAEKFMRIKRDLAMQIAEATDLKEGLRLYLEAAMEASGMECGAIFLADDENGSVDMIAHRGLSPEFVESASHYGPESFNAQIVMKGEPVYTSHGEVGIPFKCEGRVIGCLSLASCKFEETPAHARVVLESLSAQIGGAVARLQAEKAVRESEEMYRSLVETSSDAIVMTNLETGVVRVNKQAARMTGYDDPEELVGTKGLEFVAPVDRERVMRNLATTLRTGTGLVEPLECMLTRKDGSTFPVEMSTSLIREEKGRPKYLMAIIRDITERKRANEALQESEKRYRALADNSSDVIWMMDMNLNMTYVSPSIERDSGYTPEEYMAMGLDEMMTPESLERAMQAFREELDRESEEDKDLARSRVLELEMVAKDGTTSWAEGSVTFMRDADGRATGILGTSRNVNARKLAEKDLRESEEKFRSFVDNFPGIAFRGRMDFMPVFFRGYVVEITGYTEEEFLAGRPRWDQIIHPDDKRRLLEGIEAIRDVPAFSAEREYRIIRKDGKIRWVHEVIRNICDSKGKPIHIDGTILDITGLKTSEKARSKAERELEEQRALAIASDRLRSLGEMAAGIAHELNQPLVGVRGLAEHAVLALERNWELSKKDMDEKLRRIIEQADRMAYIIEHIRMFAREADKPEASPVNVNDVVNSSLGLISAQLRQRGLELEYELTEDVPDVNTNPFTLEEVILNLVTNARDAVEERLESDSQADPVVRLRTLVDRSGPEIWVRVEVADRGVGIAPEQIGRVFDPFYTTKAPDKGTGLGLAISRSIIEMLGGMIEIKSGPGGGTTVIVSLPAIRSR